MIEKTERIIILKDFYGPLLTDKQQEVLDLYYENDWTLSEIADHLKITRQGVHDLIKRAETSLEHYEERLCLVERFTVTRQYVTRLRQLLEKNKETDSKEIKEALMLLDEIDELL